MGWEQLRSRLQEWSENISDDQDDISRDTNEPFRSWQKNQKIRVKQRKIKIEAASRKRASTKKPKRPWPLALLHSRITPKSRTDVLQILSIEVTTAGPMAIKVCSLEYRNGRKLRAREFNDPAGSRHRNMSYRIWFALSESGCQSQFVFTAAIDREMLTRGALTLKLSSQSSIMRGAGCATLGVSSGMSTPGMTKRWSVDLSSSTGCGSVGTKRLNYSKWFELQG